MPTPEQVMLLIRARRSSRALTSRPVPRDKLEKIMEAARYAPTASSRRQVLTTVTNDPEKLRQIGEHTIGLFDSAAKKWMNPFTRLFKPFPRET